MSKDYKEKLSAAEITFFGSSMTFVLLSLSNEGLLLDKALRGKLQRTNRIRKLF